MPTHALRILVVDDEEDIRETLQTLLPGALDAEVAVAADGVGALDQLAGRDFDIVLTDERMPRMTGTELLAWLRVNRPRTARVLMSAYLESFQGPKNDLAHGLLKKPTSAAAVVALLNSVRPQA